MKSKKNIKNNKKIVNIDGENLHIFSKTRQISMKHQTDQPPVAEGLEKL